MSAAPPPVPELVDVLAERDFLAQLVDLIDGEDPVRIIRETLTLLMSQSGAERAYLEVVDGPPGSNAGFFASVGFDPSGIEAARSFLSSTIIAEALRAGRTIETASALVDPRFQAASSVRKNQIEAVLCVPIGTPALGVIYLQGHTSGQRFPEQVRGWTERFALHLRSTARRLLRERADAAHDPTVPFRARLVGSEALLGRSQALAGVLRMAATVAPLDVPVLLTGPSGTGKSELAQIIARSSTRRDKPFVALNCAAIPDSLLESELFGALAGAHSTATRRSLGKVEAAAGGTLFLDEVSELTPSAQAKLLQLLQEGIYWPLGATKPSKANVRVLAASNSDLAGRVADGRFREDLYYRLHVVNIDLPGLDERRSDIPALAERFVALACDRHGFEPLELSLATRHALMTADWPGHVRQLANVVLGAAVRAQSEGAAVIEPHHVFPDAVEVPAEPPRATWQTAMRDHQRRVLADALDAAKGSVAEAAKLLGIARSHAYELVKELGLRER